MTRNDLAVQLLRSSHFWLERRIDRGIAFLERERERENVWKNIWRKHLREEIIASKSCIRKFRRTESQEAARK